MGDGKKGVNPWLQAVQARSRRPVFPSLSHVRTADQRYSRNELGSAKRFSMFAGKCPFFNFHCSSIEWVIQAVHGLAAIWMFSDFHLPWAQALITYIPRSCWSKQAGSLRGALQMSRGNKGSFIDIAFFYRQRKRIYDKQFFIIKKSQYNIYTGYDLKNALLEGSMVCRNCRKQVVDDVKSCSY
jgi:hypothetical protein